jgi:hypothetical protein
MFNKLIKSLRKPNLVQRLWKRTLAHYFIEQWVILLAPGSYSNEIPRWETFKPILPPPDRDWADPFVWFQDGTYYLFIEEKLYATNIGRILCFKLDSKLNIVSKEVVLEKPYHLSYPFVYQHRDELYMVPESHQNNSIDLYKCSNFPLEWKFEKTLIPGIRSVDATLIENGGRWWLFTNIFEQGGSSRDTLHLYWADDLFADQWTAHPQNPIIKDIHTARPAGRFLVKNECLIRPSQGSFVRYGHYINFNQIVTLDETCYKEITINSFKTPTDGPFLATHTWNEKEGLIAIDAILRRRRPRASR